MGDCENDLGLDYKPPHLLLLLLEEEEEEEAKKKEEIKSSSSSHDHDDDDHTANIETLVEDLQNLSLKGNENNNNNQTDASDHVTFSSSSSSSSINETLEEGGGEFELEKQLTIISSEEERRSGETLEGGVETRMISQFSTNIVRFFKKEKNDDNPVPVPVPVPSHDLDCSTTIQTTLEEEDNLSLEQGKQNQTPDDAASDDDHIKTQTQTLDVNLSSEWNGTPKKDYDHHPTTIQTLDGELHNPEVVTNPPPSSEWDKLHNPEVGTNPPPSSEWDDGWEKDNPKVKETNLSSEWVDDGTTQKDKPQEEEEETTFKEEEEEEEEEKRIFQYPLRPEEPDCVFYLRTGSCRYGFHCKFNHPPRKKHQLKASSYLPDSSVQRLEPITAIDVVKEKEWERKDFTEGKIECKYYRTPGGCKFGKACRYYHPQEKKVVNPPPTEFNFLGLPIRPGEKKCPFFMRTGSCKYATNCRFHHPDPTDAVESNPLSGYHGAESVKLHSESSPQPHATSWSSPGTYNETAPYMDASSSYSTRMVSHYNETAPYMDTSSSYPNREWNGYQVPVRYSPEGNRNPQSASLMNHSTRKANNSMYQQQQMVVDEFPERPGQQECQYYMKNGDCKYRSACRFHHPKHYSTNSPALSSIGLPLRPGQIICSNYNRFGICKYGPSCKFDHPA